MQGYDAPESKQTCEDAKGKEYACGERSVEYFKKLIGKGRVTCVHHGWGKYNRHIFTCTNAKGQEINRQMVAEGWAVSEYSKDYIEEEKQARAQKKGIWQGVFTRPSQWRKEQKKK